MQNSKKWEIHQGLVLDLLDPMDLSNDQVSIIFLY